MATEERRKELLRQALIIVAFSAVIGLALVGVSVKLALDIVSYSDRDQETIGTVVDYDQIKENCSSTVAYSVDGTDYETRYDSCPGIGSSVTMRYAADAPEDATGNGPKRTYIANPLIIATCLLLAGVAGYAGCYRTWTRRFEEDEPQRRWRASS